MANWGLKKERKTVVAISWDCERIFFLPIWLSKNRRSTSQHFGAFLLRQLNKCVKHQMPLKSILLLLWVTAKATMIVWYFVLLQLLQFFTVQWESLIPKQFQTFIAATLETQNMKIFDLVAAVSYSYGHEWRGSPIGWSSKCSWGLVRNKSIPWLWGLVGSVPVQASSARFDS